MRLIFCRGFFAALFAALFLTGGTVRAAQHSVNNTNGPGGTNWVFSTGGIVTASPVLSEDGLTLYVGSGDRYFYALYTGSEREFPGTNRVKWKIKLSGPILASAVIDGDGIYVPCNDGRLYKLGDAGDHAVQLWEKPFRARRTGLGSPAVSEDDGTIYIGSSDHNLYALDPEDGTVKNPWPFRAYTDMGTPLISKAGTNGAETIFAAAGSLLLGVSTGAAEVSRFTPGKILRSLPALGKNGELYFGSNDERVYALGSGGTTNNVLWKFHTGRNLSASPVVGAGGDIYIGSENARLYCFRSTGELRWSVPTGRPVHASLSIGADGTIYAGSDDGQMYAISAEGQVRWKFRTRGAVRSAAVIDTKGTVYFGSNDRKIYAVLDEAVAEKSPWPMFRRDRQHTARATNGEPYIFQNPSGTNVPFSFIRTNVVFGKTKFVVTSGVQELTATNGQNVLVSIVARAGAPFSIQWRRGVVDLDPANYPSATNSTLVLTNVQAEDAGSYTVRLNGFKTVNSADSATGDFILHVNSTPTLTSTLSNYFILAGQVLTLNPGAVGSEPLFYQWRLNGSDILGATGSVFEIFAAAPGTNIYVLFVTNSYGSTISRPMVVSAFAITNTLAEQTLGAGQQHSLALLTNRTLWAWGLDDFGQLGDGRQGSGNARLIYGTAPQLVDAGGVGVTNAVWASIAGGSREAEAEAGIPGGFSLGLQTNGSLWAWGLNSDGQLGIGSTELSATPVRVGTDTNWVQVEAGSTHAIGLKRDGTIWTWGGNHAGQLGNGTTASRNTPGRVGTDSAWVEVRAGGLFSLARRADGSLWAWGANSKAQLGLGHQLPTLSPVQIGASFDWAMVSAGFEHALALKQNGTLHAWGANSSGQLGLNSVTIRTNPVQVATNADWSLVEAGTASSYAIKTNGSLWSWGDNSHGQLGSGNLTARSVPGQIAADRTWRAVDASRHALGLTVDGQVWAWGGNNAGQLGVGTTNSSSLPALLDFVSTTNRNSTNAANLPVITRHPEDQVVNQGGTAIFTIAAPGVLAADVRWLFTLNIPGRTLTNDTALPFTYAVSNAQPIDGAIYLAAVSNRFGTATSRVARLTITNVAGLVFLPTQTNTNGIFITNSPPFITQQPTNQTMQAGHTVIFRVTARGAEPLFYQWYFNSNLISSALNPSAVTATLTLSNVSAASVGFYDVVVFNALSNVLSSSAQFILTNSALAPAPGLSAAKAAGAEITLGRVTTGKDGVVIEVQGAVASRRLILEWKESLRDPFWQVLSTNDSGSTKLLDPAPPVNRARYYRVRAE